MSEIDMSEMVRMAGERVERGWKVQEISDDDDTVLYLADKDYANLGDIAFEEDGRFIGNAPFAILALSERVATLEAQNAALQARAEALGEWQGVDEYPPYTGHWATQPVHPILMVGWGRKNAQGEWENGFGGHPPNEVIGWRPLPESPTPAAAISKCLCGEPYPPECRQIGYYFAYVVECPNCGRGRDKPFSDSRAAAITQWNQRIQEEAATLTPSE